MQLFHFHNCKRHLKKRTIALDPLPPSPQRTLCTLVKMMKIMDDPLTLIVNQSLGSGIFPNKLKIAKVIPIFKKDDAHLLNNYRPISLLPTISKVFEKVVQEHLTEFLNVNKLLYNSQYGFRKAHSTETATLELIDTLLQTLDKKDIGETGYGCHTFYIIDVF